MASEILVIFVILFFVNQISMKCYLLVDGPGVQLRQPRGAALRRL